MAKKKGEIIESGTVHFKIGERYGILLAEIAQEHLTERNNPIQALKTITDSLMGCPTDLAVKILKGEIVLLVDEEDQSVLPVERTSALDAIYPKLDPVYYMQRRCKDIEQHGGYIKEGLIALQTRIRKNEGYFEISFKYEDVFKFVAGNNEALLEELRDNRDIDGIASLFEATKRFTEETMKIKSTLEWMMKTFDEFKGAENYELYLQIQGTISDVLNDIVFNLNNTVKLNFSLDAPEDNVQKYIDSAIEIDSIMSKTIVPVDLFDNYSAGWLAPNGDYYALNGEIANMLHIQIADALMEAGIIPENIDIDHKNNPSVWLEQNGWVKIHGNGIDFAGCCNRVEHNKPNVDMTPIQINKIYTYGQKCHDGLLKIGWQKKPMSAAMFQTFMENVPDKMYHDYFYY
jgi:hypothetical protein